GDCDVLTDFGGAGVSRCTKNALCIRRLLQFPGERVFAAAAPNDKNFHHDQFDCRGSRAGCEKLLNLKATRLSTSLKACPAATAIVRGHVIRRARSTIPIFPCAESPAASRECRFARPPVSCAGRELCRSVDHQNQRLCLPPANQRFLPGCPFPPIQPAL